MYKQLFSKLVVFWLVFSLGVGPILNPVVVSASDTPPALQAPTVPLPPLLANLQAGRTQSLRFTYHRATQVLNYLGGDPTAPIWVSTVAATTPEAAARTFLASYGPLFGVSSPTQELALLRLTTTADGRSFVRFAQQVAGVPVLAGELIVQLTAQNAVVSVQGEVLPNPQIEITPTLTVAQAQTQAQAAIAKVYGWVTADTLVNNSGLWVYHPALLAPDTGPTHLVWRFEVTRSNQWDVRELVLVDAHTGGVVLHFNQVNHVVDLETQTFNNTTTTVTILCTEAQTLCTNGANAHADGAHYAARDTYNYFYNTFGRDSLDNAGMKIITAVHYGTDYASSYWSGGRAVFGDVYNFPLADDVVAHELAHGVIQYEANLFNYYQSGAIAESLADTWGELVDQSNGRGSDTATDAWLFGEDVQGFGTMRSFVDPTAYGQPDRMQSALYATGTADNGEVHKNSGVGNKAVYLLGRGATFNGRTVYPLGTTKLAKLYYEVLTNLLTSGSDYLDLYNALQQGCANLQGKALNPIDCEKVRNAIEAVEMNKEPETGYNTEAPYCANNGVPTTPLLYTEDFEGPEALNDWVVGSAWSLSTRYVKAGLQAAKGSDTLAGPVLSDLQMNTGVAIPVGAYLHFAQAYGLEANLDGGLLLYSTDGANWSYVPVGWMTVNSYDGALGSNGTPAAGQSAFLGDSHGYISTRVDLATLAGQTVRFRWSLALDADGATKGWWLDNVKIYTCSGVLSNKRYLPIVWTAPYTYVLPFSQYFELAPAFSPGGWTRIQTNTSTWEVASSLTQQGAYAAQVKTTTGPTQNEVFFSPYFYAPTAQVIFYSVGSKYACVTINKCDLKVWLVRGEWGGGDDVLVYNADDNWPTDWAWTRAQVALPMPTIPEKVRVAFQYTAVPGGADAFVDTIDISKP